MKDKIQILVTGAAGQLGQEIKSRSEEKKLFDFIFADKRMLDVTDRVAVHNFFNSRDIDFVIHTAAYTKVDQAEKERLLCHKVNVQGTKHIVEALSGSRTCLIHISSDYVYHNDLRRPLRETDPTTPMGVYALSKLDSEMVALRHPFSFVLRTSWVYGIYGHNFLKTMIGLMNSRRRLSIVDDQIGQPTCTASLVRAIFNMVDWVIENPCVSDAFGVYNYANKGPCSWYDFATGIAEELRIDDLNLEPISSKDYPTLAQRPPYSVMDCSKYMALTGDTIQDWRFCLQQTIQGLLY